MSPKIRLSYQMLKNMVCLYMSAIMRRIC